MKSQLHKLTKITEDASSQICNINQVLIVTFRSFTQIARVYGTHMGSIWDYLYGFNNVGPIWVPCRDVFSHGTRPRLKVTHNLNVIFNKKNV